MRETTTFNEMIFLLIILWVAGCENTILTCEKMTVRNRHDSTISNSTANLST